MLVQQYARGHLYLICKPIHSRFEHMLTQKKCVCVQWKDNTDYIA